MEWTVVTVIVCLVGLFFTIGKPILNICNKVEKITIEIGHMQEEIKANSQQTLELMKTLSDHELRIHDLEQEEERNKSKEN